MRREPQHSGSTQEVSGGGDPGSASIGHRICPQGEAMGVENVRFVQVVAGKSDPAILVRELVRNSIEAGAGNVRVVADSNSGSLFVFDDGAGMSGEEMPRLLGKLGASTKEIGPYHNMGIGAKIMAAALEVEMFVTSWQGKEVNQVSMGPCADDKYGLRYMDGDSTVKRLKQLPFEIDAETGTAIELVNFQSFFRDPARDLAAYLNSKFFENLEVKITVEQEDQAIQVRSLRENLHDCSEKNGAIDIGECTVYWHILKNPIKGAATFRPDSIYLIWNGENIASFPASRGGTSMLNTWGIRVGQSSVVLCIEARGEDLGPSLERGDVKGWKEKETLIREAFITYMPDDLIRFMSEFEELHFDRNKESNMVADILQQCGAASMLLERGLEPAPSETPPDPRKRDGKAPGSKEPHVRVHSGEIPQAEGINDEETRRRRRKHISGMPGYRFGDDLALGGKPCEYNPRTNEIFINHEYEPVKRVLDEAKDDPERMVKRALIAAQVIGAFAAKVAETNMPPDDDALAAVLAFPLIAKLGHLPPKPKSRKG